MSIFDEFAVDAAEILSEIGRSVTLRGNAINAIVSEPRPGEVLEEGGLKETTTLSLKFLRSTLLAAPFNGLPETGDLIVFEGREYYVTEPASSRSGAAWASVNVALKDY